LPTVKRTEGKRTRLFRVQSKYYCKTAPHIIRRLGTDLSQNGSNSHGIDADPRPSSSEHACFDHDDLGKGNLRAPQGRSGSVCDCQGQRWVAKQHSARRIHARGRPSSSEHACFHMSYESRRCAYQQESSAHACFHHDHLGKGYHFHIRVEQSAPPGTNL
jgi:hypothetical protein